jgi:hypothetical protein
MLGIWLLIGLLIAVFATYNEYNKCEDVFIITPMDICLFIFIILVGPTIVLGHILSLVEDKEFFNKELFVIKK